MRRVGVASFALGFASAVIWPALVLAQPCVTQSFERPLPGARNVEVRQADVPSARFPAFWQEGLLFGYAYRIYPNATAELAAEFQRAAWRIDVTCDTDAGTCRYDTTGNAPPNGAGIAEILGACLLGSDVVGKEVVPERQAVVAPPQAPVAAPDPEPQPDPFEVEVVARANCSKADMPEGNTVFVVQTLLIAAGQDPGPVDGLLGPATLGALNAYLGAAYDAATLAQAIEPLRRKICADVD